jgi:hypothetical protein
MILRTTNGGTTWTSQISGATNPLRGVSFTDANTGTAVGDNGTIRHTTNGGTTWTGQTSGTTNGLSSVFFINVSTGTAVGAAGIILRTTTGGTTWVREDLDGQIPRTFMLEQNHPNPFNPATTISFRLLSRSFVSLTIFDFVGREVATLFSQELSAGKYSQQWSAAGLPSGVYFYRLQAGVSLETRKLMVLR